MIAVSIVLSKVHSRVVKHFPVELPIVQSSATWKVKIDAMILSLNFQTQYHDKLQCHMFVGICTLV